MHNNMNVGNMNTMNECQLRSLIDKVSFAMDDTRLYLDTHPGCKRGMEYFSDMQEIRDTAIKFYTKRFGPILSYYVDNDNCDKWQWNEGPMPWSVCARGGAR